MKRASIVVAIVAVLTLTGCAPTVSKDEFAKRFLLEYRGQFGLNSTGPLSIPAEEKLAAGMAADAVDKHLCGDEAYRTGLSLDELQVPWDISCSMYFEDEMSQAQLDRVKQEMLDEAMDDLSD